MPQKSIIYFGKRCTVACDGKCDKAFGINGRPRHSFSDDPDDYVYVGDDHVGTAPGPGETVGLSEGGDMKPSATPILDGALMNKWCTRECERSDVFEQGDAVRIRDLRHPRPNMPHRRAMQPSSGEKT